MIIKLYMCYWHHPVCLFAIYYFYTLYKFWKDINIFIQQLCIKLIKSDRKFYTVYYTVNIYYTVNTLQIYIFKIIIIIIYCSIIIIKKDCFHSSKNTKKRKLKKTWSSTTVFNIHDKKEMFLEQQISILEWFLKDHVTLKTEVMMLKIQLCIIGINYI